MPRKRVYKKRKKNWLEDVDWSVNPETLREIGSVILLIAGIIFLLSIFGLSGKLGISIAKFLYNTFGILGYLLPFILLLLGYMLWNPKKFDIKATSSIGGLIILIFFPALISLMTTSGGGFIGEKISGLFVNFIGAFASFLVLFAISIIGFLLLFNTSLKDLYDKYIQNKNPSEMNNINNNTKVSVFTTLKNTFSSKKPAENINVMQLKKTENNSVTKQIGDWQLPSYELLDLSTSKATSGNIAKNVEIIQKTLNDFDIEVVMGDVNIGPTVTQYTFKPSDGVKLNQIIARQNDMALALAAHPIRIEAPIPGKSAVGVEVPNKIPAIVTAREILESEEFKKSKSNLSISLGRDVAGNPTIIDLKKMPHLLIAGSTGSGKSICINGIIISLLYQNSPDDLKMILIDPKRVEFTPYNNLPHLLTPVIVEPDKTVNALKWAVAEMERRYKILSESGKRDIISYNQNPNENGKMAYIVIVIDELADLMMKSAKEVEAAIVRIAQMARAVGIHLVIATQRPSVNVITGLIKANIASRISFAVASQVDSRTILDQSGAEKLLGRGDMLYISPEFGKPKRIQGVMLTEKEIKNVTNFIKKESPSNYDESILDFGTTKSTNTTGGEIDDSLYEDAKEIVIASKKASASYLQRRMRIGYARAARLLDLLENQGVVGPAQGAKPREVLMTDDSPFPPDDPRLDEK